MSQTKGDQGRRSMPTRESYVVWRTATTRWRDDDAYGHLNNATYYELFDTAVNAYLYDATGVDVRALPQIGVVAETGCRYFREIGFPEPIEMGLVADKVGTSSVVYRIGLFQGDSEHGGRRGALRPRLRRQLPRRRGPAGDTDPGRRPRRRRTPAATRRTPGGVTVTTGDAPVADGDASSRCAVCHVGHDLTGPPRRNPCSRSS